MSPISSSGTAEAQGGRLCWDAVKSVESVRLDPDLRVETAQRAVIEGVTVSEIIRRTLRQYLRSA